MSIIEVFIIIFSLIFGSFLNVVATRLLKKESISYPPSHCTYCTHKLGFFDLFPLLSFLFLKGRCRYCKEKISPLYPLGEGMTAIIFFLVYKEVGFTSELLPATLLSTLLILSVLTDIREKLILDVITLPSIVVLITVRFFIGEDPFFTYLLGGVVGFGLLLLLAVVSKGGMGGGDIKLYAAIGVVLGPAMTVISLVLASFIGSVVGLLLITLKVVKRREPIAFGPSIMIGTLVAYLYGEDIWRWYSSILL